MNMNRALRIYADTASYIAIDWNRPTALYIDDMATKTMFLQISCRPNPNPFILWLHHMRI